MGLHHCRAKFKLLLVCLCVIQIVENIAESCITYTSKVTNWTNASGFEDRCNCSGCENKFVLTSLSDVGLLVSGEVTSLQCLKFEYNFTVKDTVDLKVRVGDRKSGGFGTLWTLSSGNGSASVSVSGSYVIFVEAKRRRSSGSGSSEQNTVFIRGLSLTDDAECPLQPADAAKDPDLLLLIAHVVGGVVLAALSIALVVLCSKICPGRGKCCARLTKQRDGSDEIPITGNDEMPVTENDREPEIEHTPDDTFPYENAGFTLPREPPKHHGATPMPTPRSEASLGGLKKSHVKYPDLEAENCESLYENQAVWATKLSHQTTNLSQLDSNAFYVNLHFEQQPQSHRQQQRQQPKQDDSDSEEEQGYLHPVLRI